MTYSLAAIRLARVLFPFSWPTRTVPVRQEQGGAAGSVGWVPGRQRRVGSLWNMPYPAAGQHLCLLLGVRDATGRPARGGVATDWRVCGAGLPVDEARRQWATASTWCCRRESARVCRLWAGPDPAPNVLSTETLILNICTLRSSLIPRVYCPSLPPYALLAPPPRPADLIYTVPKMRV